MKTMPIVIVVLATLLCVGSAFGADGSLYLGASIGRADTNECFCGSGGPTFGGAPARIYDTGNRGRKLIVGFRPLDWFGIEGGYVELGEIRQVVQFTDFQDLRLKQKAIDVFGVFYVDIDKFDLFAKAGLARSDADGSYSGFAGPTRITGRETDFAWGLGAERGFERFSVRLEYERFGFANFFGNFHDPDLTSVGFTWTIR